MVVRGREYHAGVLKPGRVGFFPCLKRSLSQLERLKEDITKAANQSQKVSVSQKGQTKAKSETDSGREKARKFICIASIGYLLSTLVF